MVLRLLALGALVACAPRAPARTLGRGGTELAASVGGPLFANLGPPIPLPLATVGARRGLTDKIDVIGDAHVTAAAYGVAGIDIGAAYQLLRRTDLALAATVRTSVFSDGTAVRAFPEVALMGDRRITARVTLVYGVTALAQPSPPRDKPPVFVALSTGVEVSPGDATTLALDIAWISPWQDATSVVAWQPGAGAIAVRFTASRTVRGAR